MCRHSRATLMLEDGADIRYVRQMLGPADLLMTPIYSQVSTCQLKRIHSATHPARLEQKPHAGEGAQAHGPAGSFGQKEGN